MKKIFANKKLLAGIGIGVLVVVFIGSGSRERSFT